MSESKFKAVLVGCGNMGRNQAKILSGHPDYDLTAVCDVVEENVRKVSEEFGVKAYSDFKEMLASEKPEVVAVPTSSAAHAPLTIMAARAEGVKGVYCEKPMATSIKEAETMVSVCREHDVKLVVNHQRRICSDLVKARELIESGAIGDITLLRGQCAGDFLSDGTHAVDCLLYLAGDAKVEWVAGQIFRDVAALKKKWAQLGREEPAEGFGYRYGHPVESGAIAVVQLAGGMRMEIYTGDMRQPERRYQDYVVQGTKGSVWRFEEILKPDNVAIANADGGDCIEGRHERFKSAVALKASDGKGTWRMVDVPDVPRDKEGIHLGYQYLADSLRTGKPHPMSGDVAFNGFQVVMGVYESARLGKPVHPPFQSDRFPLMQMIEEGRA